MKEGLLEDIFPGQAPLTQEPETGSYITLIPLYANGRRSFARSAINHGIACTEGRAQRSVEVCMEEAEC